VFNFLMLLLLAAAFLTALGYVWACEHLVERSNHSHEPPP
jgi:hypothetical protein